MSSPPLPELPELPELPGLPEEPLEEPLEEPPEEPPELPEEPPEEDPETELIRRLEEYKQFKETAENMKSFEEAAKHVFTKLPEEYPLPPQEFELTGLTLEGLTEAFIRIWNRKPMLDDNPESNHYAPRNIRRDVHTVQECMLSLLQSLKKKIKLK